jgi:hypothetical protein
MTLEEAANHCERAWSSYATKHGISREPDVFYLLKMQEELGELTRHFLEMSGNEHKSATDDKLKRKFAATARALSAMPWSSLGISTSISLRSSLRNFRLPTNHRATRMSPSGTFRPFSNVRHAVVVGGKSDIETELKWSK